MTEPKLEITRITVTVKVGMGLRDALLQARDLARKYGCEVHVPDFNGVSYLISPHTDVDSVVSEYFQMNASKLSL